ncbi:MAG: hypothetical protein ACI8PG_000195 [Planctomycetota bacterium]|jgi:hypothetical protein
MKGMILNRPRMFITREKIGGLRSLDDLHEGIQQGYAAELWTQLVDKVEQDMQDAAWTPKTPLPQRDPKQVEHANSEHVLVALTANRIMDASLVALITEDRRYVESALQQMRSIFDFEAWPEIEDLTHLAYGDHCSLRRGQLAVAIGLSFDWMYGLLTEDERAEIIENFDVRFTQCFKASLKAGDRWVNWLHNFCSVIYGGFGIAGMALGEDYSESAWLIETGKKKMDEYVGGLFGAGGEFNESVQYAASAASIVHYLMADRYFHKGQTQPFEAYAFDDFCRWYMYFTFPPGRVASFGDPAPDLPPVVFHYSALASTLQDPVFQWFYMQYADKTQVTHRIRSLELLYYDPKIEAVSPQGHMPLGRAYHEQGKLISSRSSWEAKKTISVVSSKAAREFNHSHADWGQVCLDGYGERLLVDSGAPPGSGYPETDRERFYNYQQWGHNVLVFGKNETGGVSVAEGDRAGEITYSEFDDALGGAWSMDLTDVYDNVQLVKRTVVHLLPRVLVVVDDAKLENEDVISLRWHTAALPELGLESGFSVQGENAKLAGWCGRLDGDAEMQIGRQTYEAPYDRDALGEVYQQRHEPFVEMSMSSDRCRMLSLFCVQGIEQDLKLWGRALDGWEILSEEGLIRISIENEQLVVNNTDTERSWRVDLS